MIISTEPVWIAQDAELADLCTRLRQQAAIAVDTEFMRTDTFYPIAGLIQLGDGKTSYLIDPLAIQDFSSLRELMLDEQVVKVLHSCSEDIEVFERLLGVVPSPIFDTQIAAAFAGFGFSLGYAGLVKAVLAIEIPKDETRSDWLQRPLSTSQLKYAALDVAHMLIVYGKLLQTLKASERLQWVKSDCADLVVNARKPDDYAEAFHKVGFAWKLRPLELAILRDLCIWREVESRARDIPRNRLIKEPSLFEIARKQPQDAAHLQRIEDIPSRTLRNDTETLLRIIQDSAATNPATWPARLDAPLALSEAPLMKSLKKYVRDVAEGLSLPPELLIRKREYEAIARSGLKGGTYSLPERLLGWRYEIIGKGLLEVAQNTTVGINSLDAEESVSPTIIE
ncbi:ribonuclease D [Cellvibrio zantedeschiae]|uniref:Ribonuclease D n=1 Tax=Cellvibrio zantedeschiae TaxID=1237077 RepID=A0ABQ3AVV5_9GAMM|nr:ribonuclease D [Cellvibrio zantedeschiae]GGY65537.1 ribonuclease D [Cellvibrio zantedeschiae]